MAGESDQTKWIGIRPTDPAEAIPVTESAPLSDIKVSPSAGNPQFETLTEKRAPAISDLQAIKVPFQDETLLYNKDCTVSYNILSDTVADGELWVVTQIAMQNVDSMCDIGMRADVTGPSKVIKCFYSVPANTYVSWHGFIVLPYDGAIVGYFYLGGASDDLKLNCFGYKIGVY